MPPPHFWGEVSAVTLSPTGEKSITYEQLSAGLCGIVHSHVRRFSGGSLVFFLVFFFIRDTWYFFSLIRDTW